MRSTKPAHSVGHSKRPPKKPVDTSPYGGRPPSRALESALFGLWAITTVIPGINVPTPTAYATRGLTLSRNEFDGMPVYTLRPKNPAPEQIIALHGGGYVGEISTINWITYSAIARDTGATVIVPIYPLIPNGTASTVVPKVANLISQTIIEHGAEDVSVFGESAGGGLALAAIQQLVLNGSAVPSRLVLIAPWLDVTISDPASLKIRDPLLNIGSLRSSGKKWAGDLEPIDPLVSPLNGSLEGLPTTYVWSGSDDLLSPQTLRLREQVQGKSNFTFILRTGQIHGWTAYPFLPSAIADRPAIERQLVGIG